MPAARTPTPVFARVRRLLRRRGIFLRLAWDGSWLWFRHTRLLGRAGAACKFARTTPLDRQIRRRGSKLSPSQSQTAPIARIGSGLSRSFQMILPENLTSAFALLRGMACSTCYQSPCDTRHAHQLPPSSRRRTVHKHPPDASRAFPPASRSSKTTPAAAQAAAGCVFPLRAARGLCYSPAP